MSMPLKSHVHAPEVPKPLVNSERPRFNNPLTFFCCTNRKKQLAVHVETAKRTAAERLSTAMEAAKKKSAGDK
jgi:hypothetical protein